MILDVHRESARTAVDGKALGNGPARERAVPLEPKVVVEPAGCVALDDEDRLVTALRPASNGSFVRAGSRFAPVLARACVVSAVTRPANGLPPVIPRPEPIRG